MKTINLLTSIFAFAIICLLSCERSTTAIVPTENDSTKTIQDSVINNSDTTVINNSDTTELKEERHVTSIYLVNHLNKPIDLEMHHDSVPSPVRDVLLWHREANVQNFTLQPNDTVYCDSLVYLMDDDVFYINFPGDDVYRNVFVNSYFFIKINYNNQQYEYTNKTDIQNLLSTQNYWYIVFNEEKKNLFSWE